MPTSVRLTITALVVMLALDLALGIIALTEDLTLIIRVFVSMGLGLFRL